jgi:hypothetical protein
MKKLSMIFLSFVFGFVCIFVACSTENAIKPILSAGSEGPIFLGYKAVSSGFEFNFSQPVKVLNAAFDLGKKVVNITEGTTVKIELEKGLEEGIKLTADILVEDEHGNTLNVLVPVRSRNDRMPNMLINEVRTEYAKPKVEFIEFKIADPGNLAAVRVFSAGISLEEPIFEFPSAEVNRGEYVVLYLRTLDPESVDETGNNLALSPGAETSPTAREFWIPGTKKLTRKTDILFIKDQDDQVIDAVMLNENQEASWSKENLIVAAELLENNNAWLENAVHSQYATATRTICRDESFSDGNTANDWYITATSSATPGAPNNTKRYEPKN